MTNLRLLLCLAACFLCQSNHHSVYSLYSSSDNVNILTKENFTQFVVNQHQDGRKLHFVHFYASWCSFCRNLSRIFKAFLAETATWRDFIDISVFSCSDRNPSQWDSICWQYGVKRVPQFRLFWFKPNASDTGINVVPNIYDHKKMSSSLIEYISSNWHRGQIPPNFPIFFPITLHKVGELLQKLSQGRVTKTKVIVLEPPKSTLGRELMLRLGGHLTIHRAIYRSWNRWDVEALRPFLVGPIEGPFVMMLNQPHGGYRIVLKPRGSNKSDLDYFSTLLRGQ